MNRINISSAFILICIILGVGACYRPRQQVDVSICPSSKNLLVYTGFTVRYNPATRQPDWADYTLTAEHVAMSNNTPKVSRCFMPDPNLSLPQATLADYNKSGWVRGHMARRQDMKWSEQAVKESDYFTNICPQNDVMNNGVWHQIENLVRRMASRYDSVHVVCGPIFTDTLNGYIGPNCIPVPDYFFKTLLVYSNGTPQAVGFICPNNADPLTVTEAMCTVHEVEQRAHIDVYAYLPDEVESVTESHLDRTMWVVK